MRCGESWHECLAHDFRTAFNAFDLDGHAMRVTDPNGLVKRTAPLDRVVPRERLALLIEARNTTTTSAIIQPARASRRRETSRPSESSTIAGPNNPGGAKAVHAAPVRSQAKPPITGVTTAQR